MSLTLYYHPLSSYCWKALVALYESGAAFEPRVVNLGDPADRGAFAAVWPLAKFPVLQDNARGEIIPESTIIIEYLAVRYPSAAALLPADLDSARQVRLLDRLFDNYLQTPMQKVVGDRLRPEGQRDPAGVADARALISSAYDMLEPKIAAGPWAAGEGFTLADCAATPALFYADYIVPLADWPSLAAYLDRLKARASVARVLAEAQPFLQYFPLAGDK